MGVAACSIQIIPFAFARVCDNELSIPASMACSNSRLDLRICGLPAPLREKGFVAPDDGSHCFLLPCRMGSVYPAL